MIFFLSAEKINSDGPSTHTNGTSKQNGVHWNRYQTQQVRSLIFVFEI